ncbi:MAG: SAM-dependent methyltransferase, partial [Candidatus Krumholzibacteriia bacterium]
ARAALIARETLDRLRHRRRRLVAALTADPAAPFAPDEWLVQYALLTPRHGWYAATAPAARRRWRRCLSRFPGGVFTPPEDPAPPSRAYRKLLEAEAHLGRSVAADEVVVDLGAAPGGWTHVALARGAAVTAVDRAPLRSDLMAHPRLTFVRGDAFRYVPPGRPADWLLSDVVAFPERTMELLARWLREGWCRRFVVTVKFRGEEDYPRLERLKQVLADSGAEFQLRRLGSNKNEVTAFGARGD